MSAGRSGGGGSSLMAGADDSPTNSTKDENSVKEVWPKRPVIPVPPPMIETISVRRGPTQNLGLNVRQVDHRVTSIRFDSPLRNKLTVGDRLLKVNGVVFEPTQLLKVSTPLKNGSKENLDETHNQLKITVERAVFSWCRLDTTTLDRFELASGKTIFIGRPLKRYTVVLRRPRLPGLNLAPLGLSLRYDAHERVTVAAVAPGSVAATHLRKWDIIKQVNGEAAHSKTMCAFRIVKSLRESGQVALSVDVLDSPAASRDTLEMPEDVVAICAKQISVLKSGSLPPLPSIFVVRLPLRGATGGAAPLTSPGPAAAAADAKRAIVDQGKPREEEILSSVPEGTRLKKCSLANKMKDMK